SSPRADPDARRDARRAARHRHLRPGAARRGARRRRAALWWLRAPDHALSRARRRPLKAAEKSVLPEKSRAPVRHDPWGWRDRRRKNGGAAASEGRRSMGRRVSGAEVRGVARPRGQGAWLAATAMALIIAGPAMAQTGQPAGQPGNVRQAGATRAFDIPAQPLSSALAAFGRQAG